VKRQPAFIQGLSGKFAPRFTAQKPEGHVEKDTVAAAVFGEYLAFAGDPGPNSNFGGPANRPPG